MLYDENDDLEGDGEYVREGCAAVLFCVAVWILIAAWFYLGA